MRINGLEKDINDRVRQKPLMRFHIWRTVYYAVLLAKHYKADVEEAIAGALLHDIDGIVAGTKNDFVAGQKIAKSILKTNGYSDAFIEKIQGVILTHSSGSTIKPRTKLEKIVANADALSHFEMLPLYFHAQGAKQIMFSEALKEVRAKLDRSEAKLTLYEARRLAKTLIRRTDSVLELYKD